jgi:very-short-patch-repair endonuclease
VRRRRSSSGGSRPSETKGRFRLNVALPIPFDGQSRMEVDLLCADGRVAIELDGAQHLSDPIAYRRDRRKDQLLQENGYFIRRFLAEDVGKELDVVLDTVLRGLSHRAQSSSVAMTLSVFRRPPSQSSRMARPNQGRHRCEVTDWRGVGARGRQWPSSPPRTAGPHQ